MIQTVKVFLVYRIHPRYKQDVAERLVLGALHVAYGRTDVTFQGPFPTGIRANVNNHHTLDIQYNHGHVELTVKNTHGFEVSPVSICKSFFCSILLKFSCCTSSFLSSTCLTRQFRRSLNWNQIYSSSIQTLNISRSAGLLQHAKHYDMWRNPWQVGCCSNHRPLCRSGDLEYFRLRNESRGGCSLRMADESLRVQAVQCVRQCLGSARATLHLTLPHRQPGAGNHRVDSERVPPYCRFFFHCFCVDTCNKECYQWSGCQMCVCACVRACVRACLRACVRLQL